jgi:hypothetical protein
VGEQLPAVATTTAGLILVFLGLLFTAWDGYETVEKSAVRSKFRRRGWTTFFAFVSAILSAAFGLIGIGTSHACRWSDFVGIVLLAVSALLMVATAFVEMLEF